MVEKTLSTGTLNLRFMQNARRAAQQPVDQQVHAQAHVKDDAEWEVSEDVRRAWGLVGVRRPKEEEEEEVKSVTYEPSYLPFLFPSLRDTSPSSSSSSAPRGRRVFNKRGEEVQQQTSTTTTPPSPSTADHPLIPIPNPVSESTNADDDAQSAHRPTRKPPRLTSISSHGTATSKSTKKHINPKDARRVIFEGGVSAVGRDLRARGTTAAGSDALPPRPVSAFLRPKNVDDPADLPSRPPKSRTRAESVGEEEVVAQKTISAPFASAAFVSPDTYSRSSVSGSRVEKRMRGAEDGDGDGDKPVKKGKKKKMGAREMGMGMGTGAGKMLTLIE